MLMIDGPAELKFLEKLLKRLSFNVLALQKGQGFSEGVVDFFPDIFFTSSLGKSSQTLLALEKVKIARGIPKVVFVRQEKETEPLSDVQQKIIDGVLRSPIDPLKLLDLLADVTQIPIEELKSRYRKLLQKDGGRQSVSGSNESRHGGVLIIDGVRKKKYQEICSSLKRPEGNEEFDSAKLRQLQEQQGDGVAEDPEARAKKKEFIKTLFTAEPNKD